MLASCLAAATARPNNLSRAAREAKLDQVCLLFSFFVSKVFQSKILNSVQELHSISRRIRSIDPPYGSPRSAHSYEFEEEAEQDFMPESRARPSRQAQDRQAFTHHK